MIPIVRHIEESDWAAILRIQSLAYPADFLESESALRAKQRTEPDLCYLLETEDGIHAYCLAQAWLPRQAPSLHSTSFESCASTNVFLHDMAIDPGATGRGYARTLFDNLVANALAAGLTSMSLVAVQGSVPFWTRLGLCTTPLTLPDSYGNDACFMSRPLQSPNNFAQQ